MIPRLVKPSVPLNFKFHKDLLCIKKTGESMNPTHQVEKGSILKKCCQEGEKLKYYYFFIK
jgi:hypothetical protein